MNWSAVNKGRALLLLVALLVAVLVAVLLLLGPSLGVMGAGGLTRGVLPVGVSLFGEALLTERSLEDREDVRGCSQKECLVEPQAARGNGAVSWHFIPEGRATAGTREESSMVDMGVSDGYMSTLL